jgi:hypothetical protein
MFAGLPSEWDIRLLYHRKSNTIKTRYDDKYRTAVANNVQDARKLLETGFDYVCSHKDEMLFRKRK